MTDSGWLVYSLVCWTLILLPRELADIKMKERRHLFLIRLSFFFFLLAVPDLCLRILTSQSRFLLALNCDLAANVSQIVLVGILFKCVLHSFQIYLSVF